MKQQQGDQEETEAAHLAGGILAGQHHRMWDEDVKGFQGRRKITELVVIYNVYLFRIICN